MISGSEALDKDAMRTAEGETMGRDKYEYIRGTQEEKQHSTSCAASFWQGQTRRKATCVIGRSWELIGFQYWATGGVFQSLQDKVQ